MTSATHLTKAPLALAWASLVGSTVCALAVVAATALAERQDLRPYSVALNTYIAAAPVAFVLATLGLIAWRRAGRPRSRIVLTAALAASVAFGYLLWNMVLVAWAYSNCPRGVC